MMGSRRPHNILRVPSLPFRNLDSALNTNLPNEKCLGHTRLMPQNVHTIFVSMLCQDVSDRVLIKLHYHSLKSPPQRKRARRKSTQSRREQPLEDGKGRGEKDEQRGNGDREG